MKLSKVIITASLVLVASTTVLAKTPIPAAEWSKAISFKYCGVMTCETYENIQLDTSSIEMNQRIKVVNLDAGEQVASFAVESIELSKESNTCWPGNTAGPEDTQWTGTYITVSGCKNL